MQNNLIVRCSEILSPRVKTRDIKLTEHTLFQASWLYFISSPACVLLSPVSHPPQSGRQYKIITNTTEDFHIIQHTLTSDKLHPVQYFFWQLLNESWSLQTTQIHYRHHLKPHHYKSSSGSSEQFFISSLKGLFHKFRNHSVRFMLEHLIAQ